MTDIPAVDTPKTLYLITFVTGAVVGDVHEAVNLAAREDENLQSFHLLTPDGGTMPVDFEDVSGPEGEPGDGTEWQIVGDEDKVQEYVHYSDPFREQFDHHDTYDTPLFEPAA